MSVKDIHIDSPQSIFGVDRSGEIFFEASPIYTGIRVRLLLTRYDADDNEIFSFDEEQEFTRVPITPSRDLLGQMDSIGENIDFASVDDILDWTDQPTAGNCWMQLVGTSGSFISSGYQGLRVYQTDPVFDTPEGFVTVGWPTLVAPSTNREIAQEIDVALSAGGLTGTPVNISGWTLADWRDQRGSYSIAFAGPGIESPLDSATVEWEIF